ncbi:metal-dependent hydrolase [Haloferax sp. S1W]|uniref:metal-dependent hydrolase n=1 Tax=Haloferax sp. S1W TaxID=3377110 RepID=UPI0037CA3A3E
MYPVGHLALGYLCYAAVAWLSDRQLPHGLTLLVLAIGTQAPDLVDKPLVFLGVLPSGRSFGHSLLFVLPALAILAKRTAHTDFERHARAFIIAVLSHFVGDTYLLALRGEWAALRFLLWPVFPAIDYPADDIPPWVRLLDLGADSPEMQFQYLLFAVAVVLWLRHTYRRKQTDSGDTATHPDPRN